MRENWECWQKVLNTEEGRGGNQVQEQGFERNLMA